ncbi:MAG: PspC domain-containing protein [Prevotellaceae bacterium]|jgi:phage shock protein PspC (stress-responsive transcriptional regulator)|nr:PspC domain-containing protein [Prevotellaceae bacterium]
MKQVENISINGILFVINSDAYAKLENYLDKLGKHFEYKQEGNEIIADIEARIAELFGERRNGINRVINLDDVLHIIAQLGSVEDITSSGAEGEEIEQDEQNTVPPKSRKKCHKRLYRNPHNRRLGGVCSGIAVWLNIDPIIVRLFFVITVLFPWILNNQLLLHNGIILTSTIFIYPILWFIIPLAKTTAQKLEMLGQAVLDEENETNSSAATPPHKPKQQSKRLYRNPNSRRVGGVCSGIAVWLNIDPVAVRLFFVIACVCLCYIHDKLYYSEGAVIIFALFVYLILWFIIPLAKTTAQKLEMYGQAVNINNIEKSIIDRSFEKTAESNGIFSEILGKIIRIIIGVILCAAGLGILFGTIYFVFIHDFSSSGFLNTGLQWQTFDFFALIEYSKHIFSPLSYCILMYCSILVLGLSMAACLYWGIHFIMAFKRKPSKIHTVLILIWFVAIIVMMTTCLSRTQKYHSYRYVKEIKVLPATDTLYLSSHSHISVPYNIPWIFYDENMKQYYGKPVLHIRESADNLIRLEVVKKSGGRNLFEAQKAAEATEYTVDIRQNPVTLSFPANFSIAPFDEYQFQQVRIFLYVPKNTFIKKDELFDKQMFDVIW